MLKFMQGTLFIVVPSNSGRQTYCNGDSLIATQFSGDYFILKFNSYSRFLSKVIWIISSKNEPFWGLDNRAVSN